jgi:molybdopterin synthase sulfur carrier subunit
MKCTLKAFGITREIIGGRIVTMELPESQTVIELKRTLFLQYPRLASLRSVYIAVNQEYAEETMLLKEGDEIALIPPVSGG